VAGILVGYARVSTYDQQAGLDAQIRDLKAAGCEENSQTRFPPWPSATGSKKPYVRRGDTLVACKPDRLARGTTEPRP
jgi:DNA invertase Pin-like site-specific DNA recombinase